MVFSSRQRCACLTINGVERDSSSDASGRVRCTYILLSTRQYVLIHLLAGQIS